MKKARPISLTKKNAKWIAAGLSAILAALILAALGASLYQERLAKKLDRQAQELSASHELLAETQGQRIQELEQELRSAQNHLASLEASFPEKGMPFNLYQRAFELSRASNVEVISIHRLGETENSTAIGSIKVVTYEIRSAGDLGDCLSFLSRLESEALGTLALDDITIDPASSSCNFGVIIAYATSANTP